MEPTGLLLMRLLMTSWSPGSSVWVCGTLRPQLGQGNAKILLRWKWCLKVAIEDSDETGRVLTTEVVAWCSLWGGYAMGVNWRGRWRKPPESAFCQWKLQAEQNLLYKIHASDSLWSQRSKGCSEQKSWLGRLSTLQVSTSHPRQPDFRGFFWNLFEKHWCPGYVRIKWGKCSHQSILKSM